MKLKIIKAKNRDEIDEITQKLLDNKFKAVDEEESFVLVKRIRYGDIKVHMILIALALISPNVIIPLLIPSCFIVGFIVYFAYNVFKRSEAVLVTTEEFDKDGNPLEFSNLEDIDVFNMVDEDVPDSKINSLISKLKSVFKRNS